MLSPTVATAADVLATGPSIAELDGGPSQPCHQTDRAAFIIQVAPELLVPDQEPGSREQANEEFNFVDDVIEVCESGDFESLSGVPSLGQVKGNLKRNVNFWRSIGASSFILSVVNDGYCLPFETLPPSTVLRNNMSALKHKDFVNSAIEELLNSSRLSEVPSPPYVVNPLSVSIQPSGKKRLILDLRHVNKYLRKQKIKYEDWKTAIGYFQLGSYMISFDLKSGYHHIDIHPDYQSFLGFGWKFSENSPMRYFVFTVLPFGLSTAPHIFTKVLKPLEKYWRIQGVNIALFLDDGLIIDYDESTCRAISQRVQFDLKRSGFITNDDKSIWQPQQSIQWLGLVWNSTRGTIEISDRRLTSIKETIDKIYQEKLIISARGLSSFVGKIISAGAVYGNLSRIMTRYCSISIAAAQDWDSTFQLDEFCLREIQFWELNAEKKNSRSICFEACPKANYIVYSDASGTGCGAHLNLNGEQVCHKLWEDHESKKSSTWRELAAVEYALASFLPLIKGAFVKWFSDSQTACRIIQVGSMKKDLHVLAIRIFQFCADHDIHLEIQWIPRTELQRADYISRIIDVDDWQISPSCFESLESSWGPHTVDCFANYYNTKLAKFFSRYWSPGCSGVDFFVQKLEHENCLVVPPVDTIGRALNYLHACRATATLVVPFWSSSYFWPLISRKFSGFILGYKVFSGKFALVHGRNINSFLGSDRFYGNVLAVRFVF